MLARSFLSAEALGLTPAEHAALVRVLYMLERGELRHAPVVRHMMSFFRPEGLPSYLNMRLVHSTHDCGTACCIQGAAELIGGLSFNHRDIRESRYNLYCLFYPLEIVTDWSDITPAQAAIALSNFLTTGKPRWAEAIAS